MDCTFHQGTAAAANCSVCGKPFCRACLIAAPDGRDYCRSCTYSSSFGPHQGASGISITSMVLSLISIFFCPVTAIPGMIMGYIELGRIKRGQSSRDGNGFALAGAIIGTVITALMVLVVVAVIIIGIIAAIAGN